MNQRSYFMSTLRIGSKIPRFTVVSTATDKLASADLLGKKLVLYFYPKDHTPGCTTESIEFSTQYSKFKRAGTEIVGVSRDSLASHHKFIEKHNLAFQLISDTDEKLCKLFDVIKEKNMYGKKVLGIERSTFLFDANGILQHEWRKVKVAGHVDEVFATAKAV